MLNDQDIQKIIDAQKDVFPSMTEFADFREEMRKNFSDLLSAVGAYAKKSRYIF